MRVLTTSAAAVAVLTYDVFDTPVFVPTTQITFVQATPHHNAPTTGCPSRGETWWLLGRRAPAREPARCAGNGAWQRRKDVLFSPAVNTPL
ncbi:hypothetical protein DFH09DRAFT_1320172 [Mycena vulgaris]|nr:hypothetical protein DFH09DRAFT_1320172 [Mycena vulgaris]